MINLLIKILKKKLHKRNMHKQFQEIQKWQDEMYQAKTRQDLGIH